MKQLGRTALNRGSSKDLLSEQFSPETGPHRGGPNAYSSQDDDKVTIVLKDPETKQNILQTSAVKKFFKRAPQKVKDNYLYSSSEIQ
jgi:hypothetical protein